MLGSNLSVRWFHRGILLLASILVVEPSAPSMAATNSLDIPSAPKRRLEETSGNQSGVDGSFLTDIDYVNPCNICQGLDMLEDEYLPLLNMTCAGANRMFEDPSYVSNGFLPNSTGNVPGTCRADQAFNAVFEACCRTSVPTYQCEENVHSYLFDESRGYNSAVPPIVGYDSDQQLNISVYLSFEALGDVTVAEGTASVFLSVMTTWNDPRLKWDVDASDKCTNMIDAWTGHDVETAYIWIPDLDLVNQVEGVQSFPSVKATVYADGTVRFYQFGRMEAFCAFTGLGNVPFDIIGCQMFFGGFTRFHSLLVDYNFETPDLVIFGPFQQEYSEWQVVPEMAEQHIQPDGFIYHLYFKRATQHYIQNVVVPTVLLTYLSFFTFCLDMRVGERLGFAMAIALVIIANQIVFTGLTPISSHKLWLDKFVSWSFYWIFIGIIQSVLIGFLFFIREDRQNQLESGRKIYSHFGEEDENDEEERERLSVKYGQNNPMEHGGEAGEEDAPTNRKPDTGLKKLLYTFSLRKFDMIVLMISVVSYTIFFIVMYFSGRDGRMWNRNDPIWFNPGEQYGMDMGMYDNNDPEAR